MPILKPSRHKNQATYNPGKRKRSDLWQPKAISLQTSLPPLPQNFCAIMKKVIFFILFAFAMTTTFALSTTNDLTCSEPTNITNTGSLAGTISFSWDGCSSCNGYEVKYVRLSDGYTSSLFSTTSASITLTGLASGEYAFYFRTVCGDGGVSGFIVIEDSIWG